MKKHLIAAILTTLAANVAWAQGKADNPGPEHAALAKMAGEYTTTMRFRPTADGPAQESTGSAKFTSVLDGRFLLEESGGEQFSRHFKARKLYGYNNDAKRYESAWVYTGSTAIMTLHGSSNDGGKTIEFNASVAQGNDKTMDFHITMKRIDDDSFTVALAMKTPGGTAGPALETTYTRKK